MQRTRGSLKVVAIIQARLDSTRLPGKVLEPIIGEPMLAHVVRRSRGARRVDTVVVATTDRTVDDPLVSLCQASGWPCYRGNTYDVLDRYYRAAMREGADIVVRITSDCPLVDPEVIDLVTNTLLSDPEADYASNTLPPRTYPLGLDVEALTMAALERSWREDARQDWREHVTPYIYRHPELFRLVPVQASADYSSLRLTVDTGPDLELLRRIFGHLRQPGFSWLEALTCLERHPDWITLNARIPQKQVNP